MHAEGYIYIYFILSLKQAQSRPASLDMLISVGYFAFEVSLILWDSVASQQPIEFIALENGKIVSIAG